MMKNSGLSLLLSTIIITSTALADGLDPSRGLQLLNQIPEDQFYPVLCQQPYEDEASIPEDRVHRCNAAVEEVRIRLEELASGEKTDVLDLALYRRLNEKLKGSDNYREHYTGRVYSYDLNTSNRNILNELVSIARDANQTHQAEIFITDYYAPHLNLEVAQSYNSYIPYQHLVTSPSGQQYLDMYYGHKYTPASSRLIKTEQTSALQTKPIDVFAVTEPLLTSLVQEKLGQFNQYLKSIANKSSIEVERHLIYNTKTILFYLPFEDGNTRTNRLVYNLMRLAIGLSPAVTKILPSFRDYDTDSIIKIYRGRLAELSKGADEASEPVE
ncbi:MAG: hypothetical protein ACR2PT_09645 [Endozoicomonas sp.]